MLFILMKKFPNCIVYGSGDDKVKQKYYILFSIMINIIVL